MVNSSFFSGRAEEGPLPYARCNCSDAGASNRVRIAQFNDAHPYFGFPNNGFEGGTYGWTVSGGAYAGFGNEPWYVNGWGSRALTLPEGATS